MKAFKLAFRLFYKNAFQHCLLILQMVLVFIIGASVVSEINGLLYQKNIIKNLNTDNYVFFQKINDRDISIGSTNQSDHIGYENFDLDAVKKQLHGSTSFISETTFFARDIDNSCNLQISCFNESLLNKLNIPNIKGASFSKTEPKGFVRFITDYSKFNIGDEIPIIIEQDSKKFNITLLVVGIAKSPFYGPTTSSTATFPDASTILYEYPKSESKYISGLICRDDLESELSSIITYDFNYHIFFDKNLSDTEIKENIKILNQYGTATTGKSIINKTNINVYESLKLQLPDIVFICLIAFVGFCGISLINISENMPTLALYSILGCSSKKCYEILSIYVLIINIASLLPTILLLFLATFSDEIAIYFPFVDNKTLAIVLVLAILFFLISVSFVLLSFKKHSTKQLRRGA